MNNNAIDNTIALKVTSRLTNAWGDFHDVR